MIKMKHGPWIRTGFRWTGPAWLQPYVEQFLQPELPFYEYGGMDIEQRYSEIDHRGDVSLKTRFTRNISINIPIVSSPMATVTGSEMAIAMGLIGGVGVLHRALSIEEQVRELRRIKHKVHMGKPIYHPVKLTQDHTKADALEMFNEARFGRRIGSIVIVDNFNGNHVVGIVTPRRIKGYEAPETKLSDIMATPCITAPFDISLEAAERVMRSEPYIKQLPLVDERRVLKGLITLQDIDLMRKHPDAALDEKGRILGVVAVGLDDLADRAEALAQEKPDAFVIDIAHGSMRRSYDAVRYLKRKYDIDVVAGNVMAPDLIVMAYEVGADAVRINIGPGAECTTRRNTGVGGSALTNTLRCAEVARDMPVLPDGGIRFGQDLADALAAGGSCAMIGTLFAGTDEAPGDLEPLPGGTLAKRHFGMASNTARRALEETRIIRENLRRSGLVERSVLGASPEGKDNDWIPYRGSVVDTISSLLGWLRSTMSYIGASTVDEMPHRVIFNPRAQ